MFQDTWTQVGICVYRQEHSACERPAKPEGNAKPKGVKFYPGEAQKRSQYQIIQIDNGICAGQASPKRKYNACDEHNPYRL